VRGLNPYCTDSNQRRLLPSLAVPAQRRQAACHRAVFQCPQEREGPAGVEVDARRSECARGWIRRPRRRPWRRPGLIGELVDRVGPGAAEIVLIVADAAGRPVEIAWTAPPGSSHAEPALDRRERRLPRRRKHRPARIQLHHEAAVRAFDAHVFPCSGRRTACARTPVVAADMQSIWRSSQGNWPRNTSPPRHPPQQHPLPWPGKCRRLLRGRGQMRAANCAR